MKNTVFSKTLFVTTLIALIFIIYRTEAVSDPMVLKKDDLLSIASELYKKMPLSASKENLSTINSMDNAPSNTPNGSQQTDDQNDTGTHTTITGELNHLALWKNATRSNTSFKQDPKVKYSQILNDLGKAFGATAIHGFIKSNSAAVNNETPKKTRGCLSRKKAKKSSPTYYPEKLVNLILSDIKDLDEFSTESTPNDNLLANSASTDQAENESIHSEMGSNKNLHEEPINPPPSPLENGIDDNIPTNGDDEKTSENKGDDNGPVDGDDDTFKSDIDGTERNPLIEPVDVDVDGGV